MRRFCARSLDESSPATTDEFSVIDWPSDTFQIQTVVGSFRFDARAAGERTAFVYPSYGNNRVMCMKFRKAVFALMAPIFLISCSETAAETKSISMTSPVPGNEIKQVMAFSHPGALVSKVELDYVAKKIAAGESPWAEEFERARLSAFASRKPDGRIRINSKNDQEADLLRDDAIAAYTQALLWRYSGDEAYAIRAIEILNVWSDFEEFSGGSDQDKLLAGWTGAVLAPAAEIMRLYPGWRSRDKVKLQSMFQRAFYPHLIAASSWNGNVDLTQIDAMMAIAVFNEDQELFNKGLVRFKARSPAYIYLTADGPAPQPIAGDDGNSLKFWFQPKSWVNGLTQESCRDNGHHSQYGLGSALHAAETAWHQGIDIYTENQDRLTAAMELLAGQLLAGSMKGICENDQATLSRFNTWEVGYNHYHGRKGVDLPNTRKLILQQIRSSKSRTDWNLNYETLTHGTPALSDAVLPKKPATD